MIQRYRRVSLCILLLVLPLLASADKTLANQYLLRAMDELQAAKVYIEKAKAQEPPQQRIVFHYEWLLIDLDHLQAGIQEKFQHPMMLPRVISPITGDYVTMIGQTKKDT